MKVSDLGEIVEVNEETINCDGGEGPAGHPNVYLTVGIDKKVSCPYCSRQFILVETFERGEDH